MDLPQKADLVQLTLEQATEHALVLLDLDGTVLAWLMGAEKMFGYPAAEMVGKSFERLFTPEDRRLAIPANELDTALRHGVGEDDRWLVRKDDVRIFVSGAAHRLCDAQGNAVGFSKMMRDRTDVKAQIDNLRNQGGALEAESRRNTLLLDTLAHELRTPLGVLSNAAQLIELAAPRHAQLLDATALLRRQVKYLQSLVEDLLELGRVKAAKTRLHYEPLDLRALIDASVESCSASLRERNQSVEVLVPGIPLDADPIRLRQVFVNLVSNASKFSPQGSKIWIKGTTEGDEAVVRVQDPGRGIRTELLPRVFDLFAQGSGGETAPKTGLGLGLTLVKEYVELHRGRVQVRSDGPGRGSEFIVRLPMSRAI